MAHKVSLFIQAPGKSPESLRPDQTTKSLIIDSLGQPVTVETFTLGSLRRATAEMPDETLLHVAHERTDIPEVLKFYNDRLIINGHARTVHVNGTEMRPPQLEFKLIQYLASKAGMAQSRKALYDEVWGKDYLLENEDTRTLDVTIKRIRDSLSELGLPGKYVVVTCRALGYMLNPRANV